MCKTVICISCLLIVICVTQCSAQHEQVSIDRPVWTKGDSWKVKCPAYRYSETEAKVKDYYTLAVEVLADDKARDVECYVLKISSQPDFVKTGELNTRYESYVYYRKTDLAVRRIKTDVWKDGKLTSSDDYGWRGEGETAFGLEVSYPTMPIVMPMFPIAEGGSVERYQKETVQKRSNGELQSLEEEDRVVSTKMSEDSTTGDASEVVPGAASSQSVAGAVTVRFVQTDVYSKSGVREYRRLTETWAPGHKWWISARLGDRNQKNIGTYILDDSPATSNK